LARHGGRVRGRQQWRGDGWEVLTMARFARQVLSGRWFTLLACLLILS
jgi:hypothetical protein